MATMTDETVLTCAAHGIHKQANYVILSEGEIVARAVSRREAEFEAMPGDRITMQTDPNPCGDAEEANMFALADKAGHALPETALCFQHIKSGHEDIEANRPEESARPFYWIEADTVPGLRCAVCGEGLL